METVYLDTHIVVWLFYGFLDNISDVAKNHINENEIVISPIVLLELQYLLEKKKISHDFNKIYKTLSTNIGLKISNSIFQDVINQAISLKFTSDPFDRIIVAEARLNNCKLVTKDSIIIKNYTKAVW